LVSEARAWQGKFQISGKEQALCEHPNLPFNQCCLMVQLSAAIPFFSRLKSFFSSKAAVDREGNKRPKS
jgi:hypothetical protein